MRELVIAGHGNLARLKEILAQHPELVNAGYPWSDTDRETAIMAAAQVGNVPVAEYLLTLGAPLDICTAAMMGRLKDVGKLLANDPNNIRARGAHGIPLLAHAALSGNLGLVQMLVERGASEGTSFALHNAVSRGHRDVAEWLLDNVKLDVNWKDYQGKTALRVALNRKDDPLVHVLRARGGSE